MLGRVFMGSWSGTTGLDLLSSRCAQLAVLPERSARLTVSFLRATSFATMRESLLSLQVGEARIVYCECVVAEYILTGCSSGQAAAVACVASLWQGESTCGVQVDRLCAVWVSHKHADHMLGLPGILAARSADQPPLLASLQSPLHCVS